MLRPLVVATPDPVFRWGGMASSMGVIPSREPTYPTWGKGKSSSNAFKRGYVSSLEGISGWWFQILFLFSTLPVEDDSQFDEHMFQRGWFNHQLYIYIHIYTYIHMEV